MFSAQYQQRPVPLEGNLVKREWFRFYDQPPQPSPGDLVVQSWDIAIMTGAANDYSVCTTWRRSRRITTSSTSFARGSNTPTFDARSQALSRGTVPKPSSSKTQDRD